MIQDGGEKVLAAYNRALETGWTYDKRVKVLLVGQDRGGKTSLSKNLRGEPFDELEPSTEGVNMIPPVKDAGTDAWTNPARVEGTNIFDHKMAVKISELLSSENPQSSVEIPIGTGLAEGLDPMSEEMDREDGKLMSSNLVIIRCRRLSTDPLVDCFLTTHLLLHIAHVTY